MQQGNEIPATIDYAGTGETQPGNAGRDRSSTAHRADTEPSVLVELVIVEGHDGQKLHTIQAEVIRRILVRLAERHLQAFQKESRL